MELTFKTDLKENGWEYEEGGRVVCDRDRWWLVQAQKAQETKGSFLTS